STLFMAPTADKTQRTLFMIMPLVFVFVIARFPAGLVLYWVTTNLWTVGQGLITRRLVARTPAPSPERRSSRTPPKDDGLSGQGAEARAVVAQIVGTLGVDADVVARDEPDAVVVTCSGPDVGLLIGRHGQTIDAVQYLLNVIAYRAHGDEKRDVVVDAAGYRT